VDRGATLGPQSPLGDQIDRSFEQVLEQELHAEATP
jgi:hypothetical protein